MEEASEGAEQQLSRAESLSRDLLRRFAGTSSPVDPPAADPGEIELNLGLSLGGHFGVDRKLVRSSSLATIPPDFPAAPPPLPLARTHSLPAETEEEVRKRKEMQSLKRLEAKRKRSEKRSFRGEATHVAAAAAAVGKVKKFEIELGGCSPSAGKAGVKLNGAVPHGLPAWVGGSGRAAGPASQASVGSQGSSSSSVSDLDGRPTRGFEISGFNSYPETKSLLTAQSLPGNTSFIVATTPPPTSAGGAAGVKEAPSRRNSAGDTARSMMEEMPCVSTTGDGPDGRRIEGFLYKYRKGEEVRIVCVCHGSFLTPAEFVQHAGGSDVAHPLRHIVVSPSPSAFI